MIEIMFIFLIIRSEIWALQVGSLRLKKAFGNSIVIMRLKKSFF